jgi:hypothetical protein
MPEARKLTLLKISDRGGKKNMFGIKPMKTSTWKSLERRVERAEGVVDGLVSALRDGRIYTEGVHVSGSVHNSFFYGPKDGSPFLKIES